MSLTSGNFRYNQINAKKQFELILSAILKSHQMMLNDYEKIERNENSIRNRLWKDYLNNNQNRELLKINQYIFKAENSEVGDNYKETGRHDIQIINPIEFCRNTNAYFIIECKLLENTKIGKGSLNHKYVENGIKRFIERNDYPSYYGLNGMIGFIVKSVDINKMVAAINKLLPANEQITEYTFSSENGNTYKSEHHDFQDKNIQLYHLMLDFSDLIE